MQMQAVIVVAPGMADIFSLVIDLKRDVLLSQAACNAQASRSGTDDRNLYLFSVQWNELNV